MEVFLSFIISSVMKWFIFYLSERRPPRPEKIKTKSAEVQTAEPGLNYQWDSKYSGFAVPGFLHGLGMVDPTPIATHAVSPDALEGNTNIFIIVFIETYGVSPGAVVGNIDMFIIILKFLLFL